MQMKPIKKRNLEIFEEKIIILRIIRRIIYRIIENKEGSGRKKKRTIARNKDRESRSFQILRLFVIKK